MFKVQFETDNDAFTGTRHSLQSEVARIMTSIVRDIGNGHDAGPCIDTSGNKVGEWSYTPTVEEA